MLKMMMTRVIVTLAALMGSVAAAHAGDGGVIDWSEWDAILKAHVVAGEVDYDGIRSEPGFTTTVEAIAAADLKGADRIDRLVFLINAYNVLSIRGILDGHSPRTTFGKLKFFFQLKYEVAGSRMTLNALEKKHLLPMGEPRIHFAIVCSSASCPPLRSETYTVEGIDEQLDDNARRFLNDPAENIYDAGRFEARLSKIFKWFAKDFGGSSESIQRFIAPYINDEAVSKFLGAGRFKIRYLAYDWSLNGTLKEK